MPPLCMPATKDSTWVSKIFGHQKSRTVEEEAAMQTWAAYMRMAEQTIEVCTDVERAVPYLKGRAEWLALLRNNWSRYLVWPKDGTYAGGNGVDDTFEYPDGIMGGRIDTAGRWADRVREGGADLMSYAQIVRSIEWGIERHRKWPRRNSQKVRQCERLLCALRLQDIAYFRALECARLAQKSLDEAVRDGRLNSCGLP